MSSALRFTSGVSAMMLAAALASCAAPEQKTGFGGKADENVGLATRAMLALNAHNLPAAIDFAERAVEKNPQDAGFRALLGNAYFAAGRFRSAEAAYKDSLTLYSNQPQVILKLALAETALGNKEDAVAFLEAGKSVLDPSNYGLALALAGRSDLAIPVLDQVAREQGADATVRQNLALAHALAGDWTEARTIAEQDVPANQVDQRIHDWMQLASPKSPSAQIAAVMGVTPAVADNGEPVRLALRKDDTMLADAAPAARPVAVPAAPSRAAAPNARISKGVPAAPSAQREIAANVPAPAARPQVADLAPARAVPVTLGATSPLTAPVVDAVALRDAALAAAPVVTPAPAAPAKVVVAEAPLPTPVAMVAAAAREVTSAATNKLQSAINAFMPNKVVIAKAQPKHRPVMVAHAPRASETVIQLGSYRSPEWVETAWNNLTQRHPALRAYLPLRARFDSPKGTFWRLSIEGFSNEREAMARCALLKDHGGSCFVRRIAGDAPVQFAAR